jgi:hypothetical protein
MRQNGVRRHVAVLDGIDSPARGPLHTRLVAGVVDRIESSTLAPRLLTEKVNRA